MQSGLGVELSGGVGVGVGDEFAARLEVAVGVVVVAVDHGAGGVGETAHRAQEIDVVEVALPAALQDERLVGFLAMTVTRAQGVGAVELQDDIVIVVEVAGNRAVDVLFDAPAVGIVAVGREAAAREVDPYQAVLHVPGIDGEPARAGARDLRRLTRQVTVGVVAVAEAVVFDEAVGRVVDMRGGEMRGGPVALGIVGVALRRGGETGAQDLLRVVVSEAARAGRFLRGGDEAVGPVAR